MINYWTYSRMHIQNDAELMYQNTNVPVHRWIQTEKSLSFVNYPPSYWAPSKMNVERLKDPTPTVMEGPMEEFAGSSPYTLLTLFALPYIWLLCWLMFNSEQ